jgi:hypothetical protein
MIFLKQAQRTLLFILLCNIISTWLHYTDNAFFLKQYPGPEWLTSAEILITVILMTPIGLLGYWLYTKQSFWLSYLFLGIYSITGISSPSHYLFSMPTPMTLKMHSLIWLDEFSGLLLICFLLWSSLAAKQWHKSETLN